MKRVAGRTPVHNQSIRTDSTILEFKFDTPRFVCSSWHARRQLSTTGTHTIQVYAPGALFSK